MRHKQKGIAQVLLLFFIISLAAFTIFFSNKFPFIRSIIFPHAASTSPNPVIGNKKVAVVFVDFSDLGFVSGTSPTFDSATSTMGIIKNYFSENSFNKLTLVGASNANIDVFPGNAANQNTRYHLTIGHTCDQNVIIPAVVSFVKNGSHPGLASPDLATYDYLVVAYAAQTGPTFLCTTTWASQGKYGGNNYGAVTIPNQIFNINNAGYGLITKGLGSNMGANYANGYNCTTPIIGTPCTSVQDGDTYDGMSGATYHLNGYSKELLGWFDTANVVEATATGNYTLQPIELLSTQPQVLKIKRATYPSSGWSDWFYIENRANAGAFDSAMPAKITGGALMHYVQTPPGTQSVLQITNLLDANDNKAPTAGDFTDSDLSIGQTFTDPNTNIAITAVSKVNNVLTVHVVIPGSTATPSPTPIPTITPAPTTTPAPTRSLTVDLKVNGSDGPVSVAQGASINLNWSTVGATSCEAIYGANYPTWNGTLPTNGSMQVVAGTLGNNFTIICKGAWGITKDVVPVQITSRIQDNLVSLQANGSNGPITLPIGSNLTLTWATQPVSTANFVGCTASGSWTGTKATSGSVALTNLAAGNKYYIITCTYKYGTNPSVHTVVSRVDVNVESTTSIAPAPIKSAPQLGQQGWMERFYQGAGLNSFKTLKITNVLNAITLQYNWGYNSSPNEALLGKSNWSARWTAQFIPLETGNYTLILNKAGAGRVKVGSLYLINVWSPGIYGTTYKATTNMIAGRPYDITIEYYETTGNAQIAFQTGLTGGTSAANAYLIPTDNGL